MSEDQRMTQEEEATFREQINRELWGSSDEASVDALEDSAGPVNEDAEEKVKLSSEEEDPMAGISPALRDTLSGLQARIGDLDTLNLRLKQAESRIGGAERRLHEASMASSKKIEAPTDDQIKQAANSIKEWESLKDDFPEWGNALDAVKVDLNRRTAELEERIPNVNAIRESLNTELEGRIDRLQKDFEVRLVDRAHKGWRDIVNSEDYHGWLSTQNPEVLRKAGSYSADDAIDVLDAFKHHMETRKNPQAIVEERKNRLEAAASVSRKKTKTNNNDTDFDSLSPEEQRKRIFEEVYKE